ncbi:MAG: hypothetical protein JWP95_635 [Actinotalea sp.]|nr:hypothetical protein [Actinotalea sp.]
MTAWRELVRLSPLRSDLERAHIHAVTAAAAGLQDAGLGPARLTGTAVPLLAEAAVTSATPFVRAPLLARLSRAQRLHRPVEGSDICPSCGTPSPCPTAKELDT